ncbi:MAG: hypothetical protein AAGJ79_02795 [Verrucomicrobiota bacterium]
MMRSAPLARIAPLMSAAMLCLLLGYVALKEDIRAEDAGPDSVMKLIDSLKMTEAQKLAFQEQETLRKESQATLQQLEGEKRRAAAEAFQAKRKAALQELFTDEQCKKWDDYWTAHFSRPNNEPTPQENPESPQPAIPLDAPDFEKANGRFQVAKRNGRVTLVNPDGQPFFSLGVTHIVAIGAPTGGEPNVMADRFGGDWSVMAQKVNENLRAWGYNSTGYGTPRPLGELIPYAEGVHTADTSMYFGNKQFSYPDVFDPAWQDKVKQTLRRKIEPHRDNPNLMGIYWTDMPLWDLKYGQRSGKTNWVEAMKTLPEEAPGRQRYEEFVAERGDEATDEEFLRLIARTYYKVLGEETRRLAPDSIIFGERYGPNMTPSLVIEEAAPWIDAVAVQPYGNTFNVADFDRIHRASGGKGIIICDHNISFPTKEHPKTMWTQLPTIEEVAQTHAQYVNDALSKPYILGYHRCQFIDRFQAHLGVLKQGLIKADGNPHEKLVTLVTETNHEVLECFANWEGRNGEPTAKENRDKAARSTGATKSDGPFFGDFDDIKTEATGFIDVKEIDGKWWFIDANGYAFFPTGITHSQPFPGIVKQFPSSDAYYNAAFERMKGFGFNSLSVLSGPAQKIAQQNRIAYTHTINLGIPHGSTYKSPHYYRVDPFSPEYETKVEASVKKACAMKKDDPFLLGYSYGFNPFQIPHKWINHLLSQGTTSPGKVALVDVYKEVYSGDIAAFNAAYGKDFSGFEDILASTDIAYEESLNPWPGESIDRPLKRDFDQLVYTVIAKVHEVAHRHVRKNDPNHLILGFYFKPYNANLGLYQAIAPFVDVLSPQHHVVSEYHQDGTFNSDASIINAADITLRTGKPIYHGDQWLGKVVPGMTAQRLRGNRSRYPFFPRRSIVARFTGPL